MNFEAVPFRAYAQFLALLPFLNASCKSCSVEGVQHRLRFCLHHLSCVEMMAFSSIFSRENRQVRWLGTTVMLVLVRNSLVKNKCETVRCRDATASSIAVKDRSEVFAHFHKVAVKRHNSMRNWLFGLPGRILCEQSPWCQRKWWSCSWLCSSPVSPFSVSVSLDFPCTAHAFFLSNHCQCVRFNFHEIYTKFDAIPLSDPSRNRIMLDTRLQIEGRKKSAHRPRCVKFCTLATNVCQY
jgi:hypothetical protein